MSFIILQSVIKKMKIIEAVCMIHYRRVSGISGRIPDIFNINYREVSGISERISKIYLTILSEY